MPECIHCNVHFQSCCGCNPECTKKRTKIDDSHRRCQGLHEQIQKILKNRLQLNSKDIVRLGVSYVDYHEDDSENWLQIMVEIKENAFIMGSLDRSCDGEIKRCWFDLGWLWIGKTRYDISREVV
ncbi:hypothetical protein [Methanobacterium formicicum]|uniref:hypothetical protein n=1 Tax=Methanobacterium formicicum TaxID=2162 RepID=UPI0024936E39|nr:hypothetical protein [Methanobacterium formicicum]